MRDWGPGRAGFFAVGYLPGLGAAVARAGRALICTRVCSRSESLEVRRTCHSGNRPECRSVGPTAEGFRVDVDAELGCSASIEVPA